MISGFNDIIDLDVFAGSEDTIFFIHHLGLIAGQKIAWHASAAVDHVDLQILVKAAILFAVTLLDNLLEKQRCGFHIFGISCRLFGVCGYIPCVEFRISIWNVPLPVINSNHSFCNTPFGAASFAVMYSIF